MTEETKAMEVQEQEMVPAEEAETTRDRLTFVPRADIYETEEDVVVIVDMPGVSEDRIDITLEKSILTIHGTTIMETPEDYSLVFAEYRPGDYERSFRINDQIDRDGIEAIYKDGVLRLVLPKAEEVKTRKISIKAG
jgi:HSP20 family molecular chaperone IbpA